MFGVKLDHAGAQAYYDSVITLYAGWGIDFIKVDDLASPYHAADIAAYAGALQRCARPLVPSLSPGNDVPVDCADHLWQHCEMWRLSADFWARWEDLAAQFAICRRTVPGSAPARLPCGPAPPAFDRPGAHVKSCRHVSTRHPTIHRRQYALSKVG